MFSIKKSLFAGVTAIAVALAGSPAHADTLSQSEAGTDSRVESGVNQTQIRVLESTSDTAKISVENGQVEKNADGTVTVHDAAGETSVVLRTAVLLSDGSISQIDYAVDGNAIEAKLSVPVIPGESEPVVTQGWFECGMGTIATIAAIGAIPLTGGASAVILPALGAGAAAGGSVYACITAAQG